jgi:hypothetical protein
MAARQTAGAGALVCRPGRRHRRDSCVDAVSGQNRDDRRGNTPLRADEVGSSRAQRVALDRVLNLAPDCDREPLDRVQVARPGWRHAAAADLADREQTGRQSVKWSSLPVSMAIARADRVKESMI